MDQESNVQILRINNFNVERISRRPIIRATLIQVKAYEIDLILKRDYCYLFKKWICGFMKSFRK